MQKNSREYKYIGALVLGMHDALVELTGIIAGLTFTIASNRLIIMTGAIAAVAANYQAQRADNNPNAARAALYTGIMYVGTSALLILPFAVIPNRFWALGMMGVLATLIIFAFNCITGYVERRPFIKRFLEMLMICIIVSVASFAIGMGAKYLMGVDI